MPSASMPDVPTILVTGATGFIGRHVVTHFAQRGWQVIALARTLPPSPLARVRYRPHDLRVPLEEGLCAGADFLVHCASIDNEVRDNVIGTQRLLAASRQHGLKSNVFLSSASAHARALSKYGQQKYLCEQLFDPAVDCVVRPGLVLGHGGLFQRMRAHLGRGGYIPLIGGGRQPIQTVWIQDLLLGIERMLVGKKQGTFALAHPTAVPYREFYTMLARTLGVRPRFIPLPYLVVRSVLSVTEALGLKLPITRENLLGLRAMQAVDTTADLARLGISLRSLAETLTCLAALPDGGTSAA